MSAIVPPPPSPWQRIKEGSVIDRVPLIGVGDMIEAINGRSLVGARHYDVARALKELPRGRTFALQLTEPRKAFGGWGGGGSRGGGWDWDWVGVGVGLGWDGMSGLNGMGSWDQWDGDPFIVARTEQAPQAGRHGAACERHCGAIRVAQLHPPQVHGDAAAAQHRPRPAPPAPPQRLQHRSVLRSVRHRCARRVPPHPHRRRGVARR